MRMRVSEEGDRVLVELTGVAGRQQSVLRALSACREPEACQPALAAAEVSVRATGSDMRITLRARAGERIEPASLYRCLRDGLLGPRLQDAAPAPAGVA